MLTKARMPFVANVDSGTAGIAKAASTHEQQRRIFTVMRKMVEAPVCSLVHSALQPIFRVRPHLRNVYLALFMQIDNSRVLELKQISLSPGGNDQLRSLYGVLYGDDPPQNSDTEDLVQSIAARERVWLADVLTRLGVLSCFPDESNCC